VGGANTQFVTSYLDSRVSLPFCMLRSQYRLYRRWTHRHFNGSKRAFWQS